MADLNDEKNIVETSAEVTDTATSAASTAAGAAAPPVKFFAKLATSIGIPKQIVAFVMAFAMLLTSIGISSSGTDDTSKYAVTQEKLCGGDTEGVNNQMTPQPYISQEERIQAGFKLYRYLRAFGIRDEAAAGIIANAMADSEANASSYEGDDINLNFELVSMHHANWDTYTDSLFAVYASSSNDEDGFPSHPAPEAAYTELGLMDLLSFGIHSDVTSNYVQSKYATNRDLYTNYSSQVKADHVNAANGRNLPGFGVFMWSGTRANNMIYFANSLTTVDDADDDMNNDYMFNLPFQIAYLLYEDENDFYEWAHTDYYSDEYTSRFVSKFLTYDCKKFMNTLSVDGKPSEWDKFGCTYTEVQQSTGTSWDVITTYSAADAMNDFNETKFTETMARNPENWHVAKASVSKTDDFTLYQYYAIIFHYEEGNPYKDTDGATQECPNDYDPYGHMDDGRVVPGHEKDVPNHDVVAIDYKITAVPVLYTCRVKNDGTDSSIFRNIEKVMWKDKPIDVYDDLKRINDRVDIKLTSYVHDIDHGDMDLTNYENDEYRKVDLSDTSKPMWERIKGLIHTVTDPSEDLDYISATFKTTGYWNWICDEIDPTLKDIELLSGWEYVEEDYERYDEAVKRYKALKDQYDKAVICQNGGDAVNRYLQELAKELIHVKNDIVPAQQSEWDTRKSNFDTQIAAWRSAWNGYVSQYKSYQQRQAWLDGWNSSGYYYWDCGDSATYNNLSTYNHDNGTHYAKGFVSRGGYYCIDTTDTCYKSVSVPSGITGFNENYISYARSGAQASIKFYNEWNAYNERINDAWSRYSGSADYDTWFANNGYKEWDDYIVGTVYETYLNYDSEDEPTCSADWDKPTFDDPYPTFKDNSGTHSGYPNYSVADNIINNDGNKLYPSWSSNLKTAVSNYNLVVAAYNGQYNTYYTRQQMNYNTTSDVYDTSTNVYKRYDNQKYPSNSTLGVGTLDTWSWREVWSKVLGISSSPTSSTDLSGLKEIKKHVDEKDRVEVLFNAAKAFDDAKHDQYVTTYNAYVNRRNSWEANRDIYHGKAGQRDNIHYSTSHPYDQQWWNPTVERGFDTYWYQYFGNIGGTDYIEYQKHFLSDIDDPRHSDNEGDDYYWEGEDMERYVKYHHRYDVRWKKDDYTKTGDVGGYQKFLDNIAKYSYDLSFNGVNYRELLELPKEIKDTVERHFKEWLRSIGIDPATVDAGEYDALINSYKNSAQYAKDCAQFTDAFSRFYVYLDKEIEESLDKLIDDKVTSYLMAEYAGSRSVRFSYQTGEDLAYTAAIWFYQNWHGRSYVSEDNPDFKAHTDPARYWYYIIRSRAWASYADGETNETRPIYNSETRRVMVEAYLSGAFSYEMDDGTSGTEYITLPYGYKPSGKVNSVVNDFVLNKDDASVTYTANIKGTKYNMEAWLTQDAVDEIYDMHYVKVCGLNNLNLTSPATLAVSMAYPYGEENFAIHDVMDHFDKGGKEIYPAVRCTETYVGVVNTIIAVENNRHDAYPVPEGSSQAMDEMAKSLTAGTLDSYALAYRLYHSDININNVYDTGEVLNYSDPATAVFAAYAGSGYSPEIPITFEDQKRYFRFRNVYSMGQAAEAISLNTNDMKAGLGPDNKPLKYTYTAADWDYFGKYDRKTYNSVQSSPIAYQRGNWYLVGEISSTKSPDYTYTIPETKKRDLPLYGYYKATSMNADQWLGSIKEGDLILTDSAEYIYVGSSCYEKFKDYLTPAEAYSAVCTAWRSDDPTSKGWNVDTLSLDDDPTRGSGIVLCTYNDLVERGICGNTDALASTYKTASGLFSTMMNNAAVQANNTLRAIYNYHSNKGEKVFIYRCMNNDYELSQIRQVVETLDFSFYNDGSMPTLIKYDGMQSNGLYRATGKETLGTIYEITPLPEIDDSTRSVAIESQRKKRGSAADKTDVFMDRRELCSVYFGDNTSHTGTLYYRLTMAATQAGP